MTRIFIADDHPIIISGVEALLRDTPYHVVGNAGDGATVLDRLATARPDILILDVRMPGRSGVDVLRTLRSRGDNRPIVLLTASIDDIRAIEAIQLGVNGLVLKDTAPELLLRCLDTVREGGRWIDRGILQRALDRTLGSVDGTPDPLASLSTRERAVVALVIQGLRNREIAAELGITEGTVKVHLHKVYEKIGVGSRTELIIHARDFDQS